MKKIGVSLLIAMSVYSTASAAITKSLNPGQQGEQVTQLQVFLIIKGFLPSGEDTGIYGTSTVKAVKAYQKSVRLPQVGNVGPATRLKINGALYMMSLQKKATQQ